MPVQRKKAGCHNYANVNDNYMLYNAAVATSKVGGRKEGRSYRGGNEGTTPNGLEASANAILGLSSGVLNTVNQGISQLTGNEGFYNSPYYQNPGAPTAQNQPQGPSVPTNPSAGTPVQAPQNPQPTAMKGGRPRGGCPTCNSKTKGGAVELAPFAASLAFLAARMSMDDKLNFTNLFRSMGSQQEPETPVERRSSARRSTARASMK